MSKPTRPAVKSTQELFNVLGATPPLVVDGDWGGKTNAALDALHQRYVVVPEMVAGDEWAFDVPGIDISAWKPAAGEIDWEKLSGYGFGFAYLKATQDDNYRSKKFRGHQAGFREIGVDVGMYHYGDYVDNSRVGPEEAAR